MARLRSPFLWGPIGAETNAQIDEAIRFGCTTLRVHAYWDRLQTAQGAALDPTNLSALTGWIERAYAGGVVPVLELATQYPPAWVKTGVTQFKDFGNNLYSSASPGADIRNWVWDANGRTYLNDFFTKVLAGVNLNHVAAVFFGGGLYGELQGPPNGGDGSTVGSIHYYMNDAIMQSGGVNLAAGMVVSPHPGYAIYQVTGNNPVFDTDLENWWLNGWATFYTWALGRIRTAGWSGPIFVPHPSYGIRSTWGPQPYSTYAARIEVAQATDPERQMQQYKSYTNVWPYSTWCDEVDATPQWQNILTLARKYGLHQFVGGEPTGVLSQTNLPTVFGAGGGGFRSKGGRAFFYLDAGQLDTATQSVGTTTNTTWGLLRTTFNGRDALTNRAVEELKGFSTWLAGAQGYIGEVGWPNATNSADSASWDTVARAWFGQANRTGIWVSHWSSGSFWGSSYNIGAYVDAGGGILGAAGRQSPAVVLEESPNQQRTAYSVRGVNLSGAEFNGPNGTSATVGTAGGYDDARTGNPGTDYKYPTAVDFAYIAARLPGSTVRLPITWERIQPTLKAALDPNELGRLNGAINSAASNGLTVIVEVHNYARRWYDNAGTPNILTLSRTAGISTTAYTIGQEYLQDLWGRLSAALSSNATVVGYGLMNEPHDLAAETGTFSGTIRYDFETGTQGWAIESGTAPTQSNAQAHTGIYSLLLTKTDNVTAYSNIRANDSGGLLGTASGNVLEYWVYLTTGQAGKSYAARAQWQNQSFTWQDGTTTLYDSNGNSISALPVNAWARVHTDFASNPITNPKAFGIQINTADNSTATGTITAYIDTYSQGTQSSSNSAARVWELISSGVVDYLQGTLGDTKRCYVPLYEWSHIHNASSNHPNGPWCTAGRVVAYEGHHYWDVKNGRAGTYAQTYANELAQAKTDGY